MQTPVAFVSLKWVVKIESTRYLARGLSCDGWLVEEVVVRATVVIGQNNNTTGDSAKTAVPRAHGNQHPFHRKSWRTSVAKLRVYF